MALAVASPLQAQARGTIEAGLFGQRTAFDEATGLGYGTAPGIAGTLGVFVLSDLALEVGSAYTWTSLSGPSDLSATWVPLRIGVAYHLPLAENLYPIVGGGVVRNSYSDGREGSDTGLSALIGIKTYLSEKAAFRSDLHVDFMSTPFNAESAAGGAPVSSHTNWSFNAGISMDFGKGRYRDEDKDGVRDRRDLCPSSPPGVLVGPDGCRLDEDRDGVFDEDDLCALTPRGVGVDATGCRVDADSDRVFDEDDQCPQTPGGVSVDARGCPFDTDADSVLDYQDACPGTPLGVSVDATGCRLDSDLDGVWDEDDLCSDHGADVSVGPDGCPLLFEPEQVVLVLRGVTFETGSAALTREAGQVLDEIAQVLLVRSDVRIRVNGHSDSSGARSLNLSLSQSRADAVRHYLIDRGVAEHRLESRGFGPDMPIATNETPEGRQQNRRVELERIDPDGR
jgi:outer membrane protein OmpA-like peptidoglycan-associated protein